MSGSATPLHSLAGQVETIKYYCPFLERGFCRELTRCNFSHDCHGSTKIPPDFCHFFLANQCLYGQDCKFRHSEPNESAATPREGSGSSSATASHHTPSSASSFIVVSEAEDNVQLANTIRRSGSHIVSESSNSDGIVTRSDNYDDGLHQNSPYSDQYVSFGWQYEYETTTAQGHDDDDNFDDADADDRVVEIDNKKVLHPTSSSSSGSSQNHGELVGRKFISNFRRATKLSTSKTSAHETTAIAAATPSSSSSTSDSIKPPTTSVRAWQSRQATTEALGLTHKEEEIPLCPYALKTGECPCAEGQCTYLHGMICDLCCLACLHPFDEAQRRQHRDECLLEHEREMELSFAIQRSKDKVCGICMDTVIEKKPVTSSRFGILAKCNHIFCLDCIRKWRGTKSFDNRTIRACPECRVSSDFVVPSKYWIEDQDDKDKLIQEYKAALRAKPCRYFNEGKGECPFAGSCFYKHAYPDGRLAELDPPKPRRKLYGARGPTSSVTNYILWNLLTSTDDDDWSEHDEVESLYYDPNYETGDEDFDEAFIL